MISSHRLQAFEWDQIEIEIAADFVILANIVLFQELIKYIILVKFWWSSLVLQDSSISVHLIAIRDDNINHPVLKHMWMDTRGSGSHFFWVRHVK